MQVPKGKKKTKFFFLIKISPGSFPKKGIFSKKMKKTPKPTKKIPNIKKSFPKLKNNFSGILFHFFFYLLQNFFSNFFPAQSKSNTTS